MNTNQQLANVRDRQVQPRQQRFIKPAYEVEQQADGGFLVRVLAPGASRDSVEVTHERGTLSISARRAPHAREGWRALAREISDADFRLQLQLNVEIDPARISARLEDGVLVVSLPVAEQAKPRVIAIE